MSEKGIYTHRDTLWKSLHMGNDMCSHVFCNILSAVAFWPQERTEEIDRERMRDSGRGGEGVSPTGGSNNLKDSGLCRWSPTELPVDQILQFSSKPLLPFP